MKSKNFKVRKMNVNGEKYEQLTLLNERGVPSWFDCPTGEWKKGFVQFVEGHDSVSPVYKIIVGEKTLDWDACYVLRSDERHWQGVFERAGFEVRYTKPQAAC
jgi:hypothetical protein